MLKIRTTSFIQGEIKSIKHQTEIQNNYNQTGPCKWEEITEVHPIDPSSTIKFRAPFMNPFSLGLTQTVFVHSKDFFKLYYCSSRPTC